MLAVDPLNYLVPQVQGNVTNRLERIRFQRNEIGLFVFGDSILRTALAAEKIEVFEASLNREMRKRIANPAPIKVVSLATGGTSEYDLRNNLSRILSAQPRAIIIQAEFLFPRTYKRPKKNWLPQWRIYVSRISVWSRFLRLKLVPSLAPNYRASVKTQKLLGSPLMISLLHPKDGDEAKSAEKLLERAKHMWTPEPLSLSDCRLCKEFLRRIHQHGIQLIVVQPPISETAERIATEEYLRKRAELIQSILYPDDVYLPYPRILPDEYFSDHSHVTADGRRAFGSWLSCALADKLAETYSCRN
jgi:hypothetical protein